MVLSHYDITKRSNRVARHRLEAVYPGGTAGALTKYGEVATRMQRIDPLWNKY